MKKLTLNIRNHKNMTIDLLLEVTDDEGFSINYECKNADGSPLKEFDAEDDDFFGFMQVVTQHAQGLMEFLDGADSTHMEDKGGLN